MKKIDLKQEHKALFSPPQGRFVIVDVPPLRYFMVDGHGDPNSSANYKAAVEALYTASYTLKFMCKAASKDFVVPPLEGLWWARDMEDFLTRRKDRWSWTMLLMVPDFVDKPMAEAALEKAHGKKPGLPRPRHAMLEEGRAVQTLHVGSYDDEGPVLRAMHEDFIPSNGLAMTGHHHEIYLGDPRKTAPERLKTILRQPVKAV